MLKAEQWPFAVSGTDELSAYHVQSCFWNTVCLLSSWDSAGGVKSFTFSPKVPGFSSCWISRTEDLILAQVLWSLRDIYSQTLSSIACAVFPISLVQEIVKTLLLNTQFPYLSLITKCQISSVEMQKPYANTYRVQQHPAASSPEGGSSSCHPTRTQEEGQWWVSNCQNAIANCACHCQHLLTCWNVWNYNKTTAFTADLPQHNMG